jgi:hypothetical protein
MLISWISKECISYQIPRILSSGWLIMCHTPQRCLCCRCSSYIVITDRVNPLLLGSLESWYWWMGEAPEWRRWDDQCKLPPAATNWWIWEGLIMFWLGQRLKLLGLITGERWIEETDMVVRELQARMYDLISCLMWNSKCFLCVYLLCTSWHCLEEL